MNNLGVAQTVANFPGILIPDRPIAFNRDFVNLGIGIKGALFLSQAIYWSKRTKENTGWFYKTVADWEEETGLTEDEQRGAKNILLSKNFIQVEKRGIPARNFFYVELDNIAATLVVYKVEHQSRENPVTSGGEIPSHSITESTTYTSEPMVRIYDDEEKTKKTKSPYEGALRWAEKRTGRKFVNRLKQYKAIKVALAAGHTETDMINRWKELENTSFFQENGFDWTSVANSFDKR